VLSRWCPPHLPPPPHPFLLPHPALSSNPQLSNFFASKIPSTTNLFSEIDLNGDGEVNWTEFLTFLERIEKTTDAVVTDEDIDKFFSTEAPHVGFEPETYAQDVAIELTFYNGELYSTYMSPSDTRVSLEPSNKIVVSVSTVPEDAAAEHIRSRGLDGSWLGAVTREVKKAVLYACEKSVDTMNEAREEIGAALREKGEFILEKEVRMGSGAMTLTNYLNLLSACCTRHRGSS
jgi:hypothetical protein